MGYFMGKFIYLMDAIEDVEKDRKKGNYNLFLEEGSIWEPEKEKQMRAILTGMMTEAARAFEHLPVLQYAEIIRNILYSGVWCRYVLLQQKDAERKERAQKKEK